MRNLLLAYCLLLCCCGSAQQYYMFIGTYTTNGSKGIYVYKFNSATGQATWLSNTDSAANPSFVTPSKNGNYLYAVNETHGANPGSISAYAFDRNTARLTFINTQPTGGDDPCYVSVDKHNRWVFVANYSGGNLTALPLEKNGSLQPYAQLIQDTGSGPVTGRQEKPHVHSAVLSPDERFLFSADLGTDKEMIYKVNLNTAQPLQAAVPAFMRTESGNGPRHFTFHPTKKYAYLVEELTGTVSAYKYNNGKLFFLQRIAAHPADYKGALGSADIHISPDGKFLYASNRGDENTITIFAIDPATGKLKVKGYQPTQGEMPRNFCIDPTGRYILVAHQKTSNIVIFKRNAVTGLLSPTGTEIKIPNPVCIRLMK